MKTLQWLYAAENGTGGIAAWKDEQGRYHKSYPEVTGYLIPTLFDYGAGDLALRLADWLVSVQNRDGSFDGLDGTPRTFDTAACAEGLGRAFRETGLAAYAHGYARARRWIRKQLRPDGSLRRVAGVDDTHFYTMRASWLIDSREGAAYWTPQTAWDERWGVEPRTHYLGYLLEGLWRMGVYDKVCLVLEAARSAILPSGLMPMTVRKAWHPANGTDACATAQFALLYSWAGMDPSRLIAGVESLIESNGGVCQNATDRRQIAWGAKYYLDAVRDAVRAAL